MHIKDALTKSYDDLLPLSKRWKKEIKEHDFTAGLLADNFSLENKRVLDIGCGLGIFVHALTLAGAKAEGVDKYILDEWGLAGIPEMWKKNNIKVTVNDFFDVPYEDNTFHAVIAENIFEHLKYTQREFLEKIYRMLAPGGILILATPNLASGLKRMRSLFGKSSYWDLDDFFLKKQPFGHVREFTANELKHLANICGFKTSYVKTHSTYFHKSWLTNFKRYPALLSLLVSTIFPSLRDTLFLVAKK